MTVSVNFRCTVCALVFLAPATLLFATDFAFDQIYVDTNYGGNGKPGWVLAGDMDGDCDLDIVAGGGFALFVYENDGLDGSWTRFGNLDSTGQFGSNGAVLFDVDGDGDLDVVGAKYLSDFGWWEHPDGELTQVPWAFHRFADGNAGWFLHDIIVTDLDQDGVAEEFITVVQQGYWNAPFHVYWFARGVDPAADWMKHVITEHQPGPKNNHAGLDAADVDGDGDIDVAFSNGWFESPGDPDGTWVWHAVTDVYGVSNTLVRDMDGDLDMDLVMSAGHHGQGVYWFENDGNPQQGAWVRHNISAVHGDPLARHFFVAGTPEHLHHPEGLTVTDLDGDQDLDVIVSELFFGEDEGEPSWNQTAHNLFVFENLGGVPPSWRKQNIAPDSYPSHLLKVVDVDGDGAADILSEAAGTSVISFYRNLTGAGREPQTGPGTDCNANGIPDDCDIARCVPPDPACADCNRNGLPDECDLALGADCNDNGVLDECEADCNNDLIPDDCDPDCQPNGVSDVCDLLFGLSLDENGDGVPDECLVFAPTPADSPNDMPKNRYISFKPNNPGIETKLQVTLRESLPHPETVGSLWWIQSPLMPNESHPSPRLPSGECVALLGGEATAAALDWDAVGCLTLHLTGCPIEPTSTYDVVAVSAVDLSPFLSVSTVERPGGKWWGDTVGGFDGSTWSAPQGSTNIDDLQVVILTWSGGPVVAPSPGTSLAHLSVTDVEPGNINNVVNIADALRIIQAFKGEPYPFGPADADGNCP